MNRYPRASDGLHKAGFLWVIFQYLTNFSDRCVDAVIGIEKNIFAPDSLNYLVASNKLPFLFN